APAVEPLVPRPFAPAFTADLRARAECPPGAGEHECADIVVSGGSLHRVHELSDRLVRDRVQGFGTVEGGDHHAVLYRGEYHVSHAAGSPGGIWRTSTPKRSVALNQPCAVTR